MGGRSIHALIAVAIGSLALLVLALWIRASRPEPAKFVPTAETSPVEASTDLEANASTQNRASFAAVVPEPVATAAPPIEGSVSGRLVGPNGEERSALVSLIDFQGNRWNSDASKPGRYEIRGLPLGAYFLVADSTGFRKVEDQLVLMPERPAVERDIQLIPKVRIRVRVITPDGESLREPPEGLPERIHEALVVVATRGPPGEWIEEDIRVEGARIGIGSFWRNDVDAVGFTREHLGVIHLECDLPVHVSLVHCQRVLQTTVVQPGEDEVTFMVSVEDLANQSTLTFRLEDERTGLAVTRVGVHLRDAGTTILKPDADGVVTARRCAPGRYRLAIVSKGYESLERSLVLRPGLNDLGVIRLVEPVRVQVRVVDQDGRPRRALFHLRTLDPETHEVVYRDDHFTYGHEEKGVLELSLGRRLYCLQAAPYRRDPFRNAEVSPIWVSENVLLDLRDGPIPGATIVLRPPARLVLRTDDPQPDGWTFRIHDDQGLWVRDGRLLDRSPQALELAPGTYRVAVRDLDGRELSSRFVTLGAEPALLELSR